MAKALEPAASLAPESSMSKRSETPKQLAPQQLCQRLWSNGLSPSAHPAGPAPARSEASQRTSSLHAMLLAVDARGPLADSRQQTTAREQPQQSPVASTTRRERVEFSAPYPIQQAADGPCHPQRGQQRKAHQPLHTLLQARTLVTTGFSPSHWNWPARLFNFFHALATTCNGPRPRPLPLLFGRALQSLSALLLHTRERAHQRPPNSCTAHARLAT